MTKLITPSFTSSLAPTLYRFVEYKRDSGFKYNSEIKELQRLDRFILNNGLSIPFTDDVIVNGSQSVRMSLPKHSPREIQCTDNFMHTCQRLKMCFYRPQFLLKTAL